MKKIVILFVALVVATFAWAQDADNVVTIDAHWFKSHYTKAEQMIPMRDGVKLYTAIFTPKNKKATHPILINPTTKGCEPYGKKNATFWQEDIYQDYLLAEYIIVFQDIRGYGHSTGEPSIEKCAQDAYDTAEWLTRKAKKNNGNIGIWGFGEDAQYALLAATCSHRAIKAASVQAPTDDTTKATNMIVPTLFVGGMFDNKSESQLWDSYHAASRTNPSADYRLVVGPWAHGAWRVGGCESLGGVEFSAEAGGEFYRSEIEYPFFDHYLRGAESSGASASGRLIYFSGENCWRELDRWGDNKQPFTLYLGENGTLSPQKQPSTASSYYTSDPKKPIPVIGKDTDETSTDATDAAYMVASQRAAEGRDDVLTFTSARLDSDVVVAGAIEAKLHAKSSLPTANFVIKLIDVADNDESEMLVRAIICKSCEMSADAVNEITKCATDVAHTFLAGHRIKVQIHSTWHPLLKSNDTEPCDITIFHDAQHPSRIIIPALF